MLNPMTRASGIVSLQFIWRLLLQRSFQKLVVDWPDVSQDVEHDQIEPLLLELHEPQVGHKQPTHEEERVHVVEPIG